MTGLRSTDTGCIATDLRRSRLRLWAWITLLLASACGFDESGGGCGDSLINNYRFDRWCGDNLCNWTTVSGSIRRAPTWHANDFGVELVDTPTVLSQTRYIKDVSCIEFELISDVELSADVWLAIDFNMDGSFETETQIPSGRWKPFQLQFPTPVFYSGIVFEIRKQGDGHAVLAELRAQSSEECSGARPLLRDAPLGVACADSSTCASGICASVGTEPLFQLICLLEPTQCGVNAPSLLSCGECLSNTDCSPTEVCGIADSDRGLVRVCAARGPFGEPCVADDNCVDGRCVVPPRLQEGRFDVLTSLCGECSADQDCASGEVCGVDPLTEASACVEVGQRANREICAFDAECASGVCCLGECADCCEAAESPVSCAAGTCVVGTCQ